MNKLVSILVMLLATACHPGKTGDFLGGLNQTQFKELDAVRSNWSDARGAYLNMLGDVKITASTGGRAAQMAKMLKDSAQCSPTIKGGSYTIPLNEANYTYERGVTGTGCAIAGDETKTFSKSATGATYSLNQLYQVSKNSYGAIYQRQDDLRAMSVLGGFTVNKRGSAYYTSGGFTVSTANVNDSTATVQGDITVSDGMLLMRVNFQKWQLTAQAVWNTSYYGSPVTYSVQGQTVTASQFNSAFEDFHVPDIIKNMQDIPRNLN